MAGGSIDYVLNLKADGTAATGEIDGLQGSVGGLDSKLKGLGVAGLAAGVLVAVDNVATLQNEIGNTANLLDLSAEDASRLTGALAKVGVEAEDVAVFALDIAAGFEDSDEILERLGVTAGDVATPLDAVKVAIDNWDLLTPVERIELFGEEAALALGKLATGGQTATDILNDIPEARVYTQEQIDQSAEYVANMRDAKLAAEGIVNVLAENVIPLLSTASGVAATVGEAIEGWSDESENVDSFMGNFIEQLQGAGKAAANIFDREYQQNAQDRILNVRKDVVDLGNVIDDAAAARDVDINSDTAENRAEAERIAGLIDYVSRDRNMRIYGTYVPPTAFGPGPDGGPVINQTVNMNYGRAITPSQFADAAAAYSFSNGGNPI